MIIEVDTTDALPAYEQIRQQVTRMVIAGTLDAETRMPTIRQLAKDLQLAKGTVAKAYALLEEARVVESRGHKGTFICDQTLNKQAKPERDDSLRAAADAYFVAARQLGAGLEEAADLLRARWVEP